MSNLDLKKLPHSIPGNLLLIILDGIALYKGEKDGYHGNAFDLASTPILDQIFKIAPVSLQLLAHGPAVGLPSKKDMGNSEVGHNAMGAGRIYDQGARLVSEAVSDGSIYNGKTWMRLIGSKSSPGLALEEKKNRAVHFIGLLSDGNVHSHIDHLFAMLKRCADASVKRLFVHTLLDGRDVAMQSAEIYIERLEKHLKAIEPPGTKYAIASGGGRMQITMDRYVADWEMVKQGWETHVAGKGRLFPSAMEAIIKYRAENPGISDQNLPPFVITKEGTDSPIGPVNDDDIVIFFNFRGDRAIEISRAFTEKNFTNFKRDPEVLVNFAGLMEYDGDLKIPPVYLVEPPDIKNTLTEYLVHNHIGQYAISETQKFGHVTFFWNGNNSQKLDEQLETWIEIPSDRISFNKAPRMKADAITETLIKALTEQGYKFLRVNFANGDMVGHTGDLLAACAAVEAIDENLEKLIAAANQTGTTIIITADHGNCEQMHEVDKNGAEKRDDSGDYVRKTSHTLNPVPFLLLGADSENYRPALETSTAGIANMAATILTLLGFEPPDEYLPSLVNRR